MPLMYLNRLEGVNEGAAFWPGVGVSGESLDSRVGLLAVRLARPGEPPVGLVLVLVVMVVFTVTLLAVLFRVEVASPFSLPGELNLAKGEPVDTLLDRGDGRGDTRVWGEDFMYLGGLGVFLGDGLVDCGRPNSLRCEGVSGRSSNLSSGCTSLHSP